MSRVKQSLIAIAILCVCGGASYYFTSVKKPTSANDMMRKMPPPRASFVGVANAQKGTLKLFYQGLGTIIPLANVTVKSRIDGQVMELHFKEGQFVKEGDLLASIDARTYEVQLKQAQGQLLKDQALLENALIDLKRYEVLLAQDSISKQQLDTQQALVHQYQGTIKVDEAAIDSAKLQIEYSSIKAPISGRIGLRLVDKGNMIHASDTTGLAVITQLNPIAATFSLPEDKIPSVMEALQKNKNLEIEAYDRSDTQLIAKGHLASVDNQIDTATGTLKLKAEFNNADTKLFPNQFVNIHLLVETKQDALQVPSAAVQYGAQGAFTYRVKEDSTVSVQRLKVGSSQNGVTLIEEGLQEGDKVVIDGVDKLREGSKVEYNSQKEGVSKALPAKSDAQK